MLCLCTPFLHISVQFFQVQVTFVYVPCSLHEKKPEGSWTTRRNLHYLFIDSMHESTFCKFAIVYYPFSSICMGKCMCASHRITKNSSFSHDDFICRDGKYSAIKLLSTLFVSVSLPSNSFRSLFQKYYLNNFHVSYYSFRKSTYIGIYHKCVSWNRKQKLGNVCW